MFVYAKKPFTDDDDDDDEPADDDFCSSKAGGKKHKKKKVEYPSSKKAAAPPKKMIMIDCDGSDDEKFVTTATNKAISDVSRLMAEINSEDFEAPLVSAGDDEHVTRAKEMLSELTQKKKLLEVVEENSSVAILPTSSSIKLHTVRNRTAEEKALLKEKTAENIRDELLISIQKNSAPQADQGTAAESEDIGYIWIKTRLNQKHESKFRILAEDEFMKFREVLSKFYDMAAASIKMQIDGQTIKDNQTPEDFDLDNDDLIDISIPKELYDSAVAASKTASERQTDIPKGDSTTSSPVKAPAALPRSPEAVPAASKEEVEHVVIHITVPSCLTVKKQSSADFDLTVFKNQTLQSMHDVLVQQPHLCLQKDVCYALSTCMGDDLNMDLTFKALNVVANSLLIVRLKPMLVSFLLNGFTSAQTKELITEPLTVKLRGNVVFGQTMQSIAKYVGMHPDGLNFFLDGISISDSKHLSLMQLGVTAGSEIEVLRKDMS
jgi:nucleoside 2-deoxyribosyltransferase